CGFHGPNLTKMAIRVERDIRPGLYIAPPRSERHLTKPLSRYGLEKRWTEGFRIMRSEEFWGKPHQSP
ncbi:MAG: hypothetical protein QXJ19_01310, partial [Candidatus Bathyarchaeia archaeon]